MNILDLPVELGIIILKYLDLKSKTAAYRSCLDFRKFFATCHVKNVVLSKSSLASAKSLKNELIADYIEYIQHLDLSGIQDLGVEDLKPLAYRMSNLKHLDITFTNVYLSDLVDICPPALQSICMNFFKSPRNAYSQPIWTGVQELIAEKKFKHIHFIVFELLDSDLPLALLKDHTVEDLKITVADNYKDFWDFHDDIADYDFDSENIEPNFGKLCYIFRDCRVTHKTSKSLRGVSNLNFNRTEYIFLMYMERIVIYVSPVFKDMFFMNCSDLSIDVCPSLPKDFMLDGNIIFKAWNKETTVFDDDFFKELCEEFKDYFPIFVCMHDKNKMTMSEAKSEWYCIDSCIGIDVLLDELPEKVTLTNFCRRDSSVIPCYTPVTLSPQTRRFNNITYLRLSNIFLDDFFGTLFNISPKLATLDIYVEKQRRGFQMWLLSLARSISNAKSLKNFKLTTEDVDYRIIFDILSCCPTLENVHICEYERLSDDADNEWELDTAMSMIENCLNLYSLFIEADMSPEYLTLLTSPLRQAAQKLQRDHLYIEVCDCYRGWNPFLDVFNPSPLHILD